MSSKIKVESRYPFGEFGATECEMAQKQGWAFADSGVRTATGWATWAHHAESGDWALVVLACPDQYPDAWPERPEPIQQLELLNT